MEDNEGTDTRRSITHTKKVHFSLDTKPGPTKCILQRAPHIDTKSIEGANGDTSKTISGAITCLSPEFMEKLHNN